MSFDALIEMLASQPFFDLATAVQLSGESRAKVRTQLYRWAKAGKLLPLRRGMYALAERYRKVPINQADLANHLYKPSYLSCHWALQYHGMIPEAVFMYTSVTSRVPRRFENAFGLFDYRHVKQSAFFGYRADGDEDVKFFVAEPEKALLDLWHLHSGAWSEARMVEMRFQNWEAVDQGRLREYAERFDSPRLRRAAELWCDVARSEQEGWVTL
jgi:predicted transcriptional regulator of viral defense system